MSGTRIFCAVLLVALAAIEANTQTLRTRPAANSLTDVPAVRTIALSVPAGAPLQIALDRDRPRATDAVGVRIRSAGFACGRRSERAHR